jgi:hypothetical protein
MVYVHKLNVFVIPASEARRESFRERHRKMLATKGELQPPDKPE